MPPATVMSIVAGLLVRSAQFVKCGAGASVIPLLFAHSLREVNPQLASCLEIAAWPHDRQDLQHALLESAECVTVTGSDEALAAVGRDVPVSRRFVGYGHKVSFAYLTAEALVASCLERIAEREPAVLAFAFYDADAALAAARRLDGMAPSSPLHGIPVGIKDIIDTADMPTECNSPIYTGHRPAQDATCVHDLRSPDFENLGSGAFCDLGSPMAGRKGQAYRERKRR